MDKKNIFEKNKSDKKKPIYYVMMIACVLIIGAISFISYKSVQGSLSQNEAKKSTDKVDTNITDVEKTPTETVKVPETVNTKPEVQAKENTEKPIIPAKEYLPPITGKVTAEFSLNTPIYSETLKDWRIHDGIDISADLGATVVAVNDGSVEKIESDDLYGITVVIKHTDGKKSKYCNLDDSVDLEEGQIINRGDNVGKVGNTAIFEISDGPHLHFEMSENGKKIDPLTVFKVQE